MHGHRDVFGLGRLGLLQRGGQHIHAVVAVVAAIGRGLLEGLLVLFKKLAPGHKFLGLQHGRGGVDTLDDPGGLDHVGRLDGVAPQQPHPGVVDLLQRLDERNHLVIVQRGHYHLDACVLDPGRQIIKSHRLVVKRLAQHHLFLLGLELLGRTIGQALAVGRAVVQRGVARGAKLRGRKRTNGTRLQTIIGHHAEGGAQPELRKPGVGRNGDLRNVLGTINGRGLYAHP